MQCLQYHARLQFGLREYRPCPALYISFPLLTASTLRFSATNPLRYFFIEDRVHAHFVFNDRRFCLRTRSKDQRSGLLSSAPSRETQRRDIFLRYRVLLLCQSDHLSVEIVAARNVERVDLFFGKLLDTQRSIGFIQPLDLRCHHLHPQVSRIAF